MPDFNDDSKQKQNKSAVASAAPNELEGKSDLQSALIPLEDGEEGGHVILVHGIADFEWNSKQRWRSWQAWLSGIGLGSEHKVWRYQYDLESDDPRVFARNGIESEALGLLDCLGRCRADETGEMKGKKRFVFVTMDIGGVIVKRALTIASVNPVQYGNLDFLTSTLVFVNCPHRAAKIEHLEDQIGELLSLNPLYPSSSVKRIQNLSRSIQETNDAFLDTKLLSTAFICNLVSDTIRNRELSGPITDNAKIDCDVDDDDDDDNADGGGDEKDNEKPQACPDKSSYSDRSKRPTRRLDRPFPYYGIPCEATYKSRFSHFKLVVEGPSEPAAGLTELLVEEIKTAISNSLKTCIETKYVQLIQSQTPLIYPPDPVRSDWWSPHWIDRILESEEYQKWSQQNGLTVLHLHGTSNVSDVSQALMEHLNQAAGRDSLKPKDETNETLYFEFNHSDVRLNNIHAMLTFFVNVLYSRFGHVIDAWASDILERIHHYRSWSRDDLYYAIILLDWSFLPEGTLMVGRFDECDDESRSWFLEKLSEIRNMDHNRAAWIITSQGNSDMKAEIFQWTTIYLDKLIGGALTDASVSAATKMAPPNPPASYERDLLSYVQYAVRPMTVDELAIMVFLPDQSNHSEEDDSHRKKLVRRMVDTLNPLIFLQNNEVRPNQLSLATDLVEASKAHANLARRCLQYLRDPAVQGDIKAFCHCYSTPNQVPMSLPRHSPIYYAVMYWAAHYRLAGENRPSEQALEFLSDPRNRIAWSEAYYTLANPLVRLPCSYLSPLPLVSMLGLDDLVAEYIRREMQSQAIETDCGLALSEAARNGHASTAGLLMKATRMLNSALRGAIAEAASFGAGGALHELVKHASTIDRFEWPSNLLQRVASLGLHEVAKILLNSGLETNPSNPLQGRSPLHLACLHGHLETVKVLLEANADLRCRAKYDRLPIHAAARNGHPEIITCLLDAGSDIEGLDEDGLTPLQSAIISGAGEAIETLLRAGANPSHGKDGEDDPAWSEKPLLYCARYYPQGMRLLLEHNVDLNCKSGKRSPLCLAVSQGQVEIARMLLDKGADPNENPIGHDLLLINALELGDKSIEMAKLLLDHGARIEEEDSSSPWRNTALSRAAGIPSVDLVKYLVERGADVNHCGKDSSPPLYSAAWSSNFDNVRILLDAGADVNVVVESNNWRPVVAAYDNVKILRLLLEKGADVNAISTDGTCLHLAVTYNMVDCVKLLVKHIPRPDLEVPCPTSRGPDSDDGYTALGLACDNGNAQFVRLLLEAGANKSHTSRLGKRPLDICVQTGNVAAASVLLEYRTPIDYTDDEGNTVLHHISSLTPRSLIRMLVNAGADPYASNQNGITALQRAVESPNAAVVKYLLSKNTGPAQSSDASHSLVHIACAKNDLATVRALVNGGADVQQADSFKGRPSLLMTLIEKWREPDLELLRYLVETSKVDVNRWGGYMGYPVIAACAYGHAPHAEYLLEHGANPNTEDSGGRRPIHLASVHEVTDIVDTLLTFNAETIVKGRPPRDKMGRSPVHFAAVGGNWNVFKKVSELYSESELTMPDNAGWTPLFWALLNGSAEVAVVQHLIDHGADLWAKVKSRKMEWSPLKLARYTNVSDAVRSLLTPNSSVRVVGSENIEQRWDEKSHFSKPAAYKGNIVCDSCRVFICGINYSCRTCEDYDLCFRCYMSRDVFHLSHPEDDWDETGPEYVDDETTMSNDEGQQTGNSTLDDETSQIEPDSLEHDSDHDDENDKDDDLYPDSDSSSIQEAENQSQISGDDED